MSRHIVRWFCAAALLLGLTGCTSLTDPDGSLATPTPEPSPTELTGWEQEQLEMFGQFGIPEPTPEPFTKENLPDPTSFMTSDGTNALTKVKINDTGDPVSLRISHLVKNGPVIVQFVCVDGTITLEGSNSSYSELDCDGQYTGVHFDVPEEARSFNINLTATAGTSYTLSVYQDPDLEMAVD
ncbi:hypothetical protein CQ018_15945 [Arthrobacter sp. MYb227]|uniref:hypothetical protein n=1 Tax=Arthrobacter sp. MYb227 TaxID=1848601 RepID=UPI000CFA8212|nr:hypothetical protein [Arthrobacter sp. MYb227]PQZ89041.1 hypothetical protein CQ018_15945 [Arthrobacter sp. MYb227]